MPAAIANSCVTSDMAQPAHIDLITGPDRFYRVAVWLLWLIAVAVTITQVQVLAWPLSAAACGLLLMLWPGLNRPIQRTGSLRLYPDGAAKLDGRPGCWGKYSRCSRWYVILVVKLPQSNERVLVSSRRNRVDDYRRLLQWTRFPSVSDINDRHRQLS